MAEGINSALIFLSLYIFEVLVSQDLRRTRVFRDGANPFDISDVAFIENFRLSKGAAYMVINALRHNLEPVSAVSTALSAETKVLCALSFYAYGSYQRCIGNCSMVGLSQPSVSRSISQVTDAICSELLTSWIQFPADRERQASVKRGFNVKFGFPGVIGAIDCTHIEIIQPVDKNSGRSYVYKNRKGLHSLNVQMICDSELRIMNVNSKFPGSCHDSFIWKSSNVRHAIIQNHEVGSWLLGDARYPLEPWLLTPVQTPVLASENSCNTAHIKGRNAIERCFGILKSRFRCLLHTRELNYCPVKAGTITNACAVLHNICIHFNINPPPPPEIEAVNEDPWGPMLPQEENRQLRVLGQRTRANLICSRFET